jgi:hypothetical protein
MALTVVDASGITRNTPFATGPVFRFVATQVTGWATPSDVAYIKGSATKTVRVRQVRFGGFAGTAGSMNISLIKRSTAYTTLGSATENAWTALKLDSNSDAATATGVYITTANYTSVGTKLADVDSGSALFPAAATAAVATPMVFDFTKAPLILRGTSEFLHLNCQGVALPASGKWDIVIEWEEDNS